MGGLARICKQFGGIVINDEEFIYDYDQDKPVPKKGLSKSEIARLEKVKWMRIKERIEQ